MKTVFAAATALAVVLATVPIAAGRQKKATGQAPATPVIVIKRPTVIAFFPPVSDQELENDAGTIDALADFQFYAAAAREPLAKAGVDLHEIYARSFRVRDGARSTTFRSGNVEVGYYLVAPGKKRHVEEDGVMTDTDLFGLVRDHFGITVR
jgi:hypothetical protein